MSTLPLALYRVLLGLYPPGFRRAYGAEMQRLFREQWRDALGEGGSLAVAGLCARTIADLMLTALAQRLNEGRALLAARSTHARLGGLAGVAGGSLLVAGAALNLAGELGGAHYELGLAAGGAPLLLALTVAAVAARFGRTLGPLGLAGCALAALGVAGAAATALASLLAGGGDPAWSLFSIGLMAVSGGMTVVSVGVSGRGLPRWLGLGFPLALTMAAVWVTNPYAGLRTSLGLSWDGAVLAQSLSFAAHGLTWMLLGACLWVTGARASLRHSS